VVQWVGSYDHILLLTRSTLNRSKGDRGIASRRIWEINDKVASYELWDDDGYISFQHSDPRPNRRNRYSTPMEQTTERTRVVRANETRKTLWTRHQGFPNCEILLCVAGNRMFPTNQERQDVHGTRFERT